MADLSVRSDSVDVEQIMRQIRARIREKRGVDYTEAELQQLANVKLEKFLDPRGVRSDLVEQFKKHRIVSPAPPNFEFEDTTLYETHRGLLRVIRKMLNPFLKLFFNPNRIVDALHIQAEVNAEFHRCFRQREEMDPLFYEVIHNLVVECDATGRRSAQPQDARRVAQQPAGLRRAARAVARERRAVPQGAEKSGRTSRSRVNQRSPGDQRSPGEQRGPS